MLVIGLAECYLACQNKFPMCNSGCNTFKAAAVTRNIRRQVRNSGAADPNTCTIKENVCETLGAKITLVWHTNMFFISLCVRVLGRNDSNVQRLATLKFWNWKGLMLRFCIRFSLSNIRQKSLLLLYCSCFEYEQMVSVRRKCVHLMFEDSPIPFPLCRENGKFFIWLLNINIFWWVVLTNISAMQFLGYCHMIATP